MKPKFIKHPEKFTIDQWGPIDFKMLYPSFWFGPMSGAVKSPYGIYWGEGLIINKYDKEVLYWPNGSLESFGLKSINKWLLPKDSVKKLEQKYQLIVTKLEKLALEIENITPDSKPENIKRLALDWHRVYEELWSWSNVFEFGNFATPLYLKNKLIDLIPQKDLDSVLQTLLAPEDLSFNQRSQKELLECRLKAKSPAQLQKLLTAHSKKWFWLDNSYLTSKKLDADYFYSKIKSIPFKKAKKELLEINNYPAKVKRDKRLTIKKFNLPKSIEYISSVFSQSIWLQDNRKAVVWRSSDTITILAGCLAKKLNITFEEILNYTADEFRQAFRTGKKLSGKMLAERVKLNAIYTAPGIYKFLSSNEAKKLAVRFSNLHGQTDKNTLTGITVSKTEKIVCGKVRVLHSAKDVSLMKRGEILVAAMTSPDYIHAMRLAKAIITDTGGLMSHAAVVSRELNIPCITNTKLATKILKDGDKVEVDTNKGIVKKL